MTLAWPDAFVIVGALASFCVALKVSLPFLVGRSTAEAQRAALDEVNKRLTAVESHLVSGVRKMPGRLG